MRTREQIIRDLEINENQQNTLRLEHDKLNEELFHAEFVRVAWEEAEELFKEILPVGGRWAEGPRVATSEHRQNEHAHIVEEDGVKEMWISGYRNRDGVERGKPIYIEREYAEQVKPRY
jgi:hypothetical protein